MKLLSKLFGIKTPGEAVFVVIIIVATALLVTLNYWQHHQRYHRFVFESESGKDEVFIEKMKNGTVLVHKAIDKRSGYPTIHYQIKMNNGEVIESSMILGEFEVYPSEIIFQEYNGSISPIDQYDKRTTAPLY